MTLQTLLGEMPAVRFLEEYFHRLPLAMPGTARPLCPLASWETVGAILALKTADVLVVRGGARSDVSLPATVEEAKRLSAEGHTILIRHAERQDQELRKLADTFEADFHAPVDVHLYLTPPGEHGFSWHYDAEDVFILQTGGKKEYTLRKNTVQPWPLVETIPANMRYERELMPLLSVLLAAGDWLYVPCGYWHKAEATVSEETAISLAVGVMSPAAIDLYDLLRTRLLSSLLWRQRLPIRGAAATASPEDLLQQYREIARQLADDLSQTLQNDYVLREFIEQAPPWK